LLNDDKDIEAVFTGVSGSGGLKQVLASLDSKQQALVMGHAVPMPVVVRTRPYDEAFYKAVQRAPSRRGATILTLPERTSQEEVDELFPD
jgi:hypothetical protein